MLKGKLLSIGSVFALSLLVGGASEGRAEESNPALDTSRTTVEKLASDTVKCATKKAAREVNPANKNYVASNRSVKGVPGGAIETYVKKKGYYDSKSDKRVGFAEVEVLSFDGSGNPQNSSFQARTKVEDNG